MTRSAEAYEPELAARHSELRGLSPQAQQSFKDLGYHFPVRAFTGEAAQALCERFFGYCQQNQSTLDTLLPRERIRLFAETHLFLRWVYDIVASPRVLDAVESVLGPDLMVWSSQWFPKFPHDGSFVSWHQDAAYWGLTPPNVVTAWIALTESNSHNGCMRVLGGTHKGELLPQQETYAAQNMLSRGQSITSGVDERNAVMLELEPGEFSLHHVGLAHSSGPNESGHPRIGLAIRYVSPDVVQHGNARDMVMLLRGRDGYDNFDVVAPPERDFAFGESELHASALARKRRNLMPE